MANPHQSTPCAPCARKRRELAEAAQRLKEAAARGDIRTTASGVIQTARHVVEGAAMMAGLKKKD